MQAPGPRRSLVRTAPRRNHLFKVKLARDARRCSLGGHCVGRSCVGRIDARHSQAIQAEASRVCFIVQPVAAAESPRHDVRCELLGSQAGIVRPLGTPFRSKKHQLRSARLAHAVAPTRTGVGRKEAPAGVANWHQNLRQLRCCFTAHVNSCAPSLTPAAMLHAPGLDVNGKLALDSHHPEGDQAKRPGAHNSPGRCIRASAGASSFGWRQ